MVHQNRARSWGHRLREENSALKEKIASLRKENARLRKDLEKAWELMAHVPGGLFLLQRETIAYANEAASRWLGYSLGELAGKSLLEILDAEDAPAVLEYIRSRAGTETPDTFRFRNSAGESVFCAVHLKKTRYEGRSALLVNVIEIERKMEEERSILEARKFEALRKMAGAFAQELETTATSEHPLSTELTDLSREAYHPSELTLINMNEVIEASAAGYCSPEGIHFGQAPEDGNRIRFTSALNASSPLNGCQRDLQNAFTNLIRNAVEALEEAGEIYVTAQEKPGIIHVYVQENGCGIDENVVDKIFDPFFTTKGTGHKGLGLSVARSIIERHGGRINVVRHRAGGTSFHVELPLDQGPLRTRARPSKKTIKNASIVLLGDQHILNNLLRRFLSSKNLRITQVDSHGECLKALRGDPFDLLLVDQRKTRSETARLVSKVRQTSPDTKIVLFNASGPDGTGSSRAFGADLALTRPLHLESLYARILQLMTEDETSKRPAQ